MSSNANLSAKMSPANLRFAIKVRSIFTNYCQGKKKNVQQFQLIISLKIDNKVFFKIFKTGKKILRKENSSAHYI